MSGYTILLDEDDFPAEPVAVRVEQWYDRSAGVRSWVTMLVDENGHQVGSALYDGERAGAAASKAMLQGQLDAGASQE